MLVLKSLGGLFVALLIFLLILWLTLPNIDDPETMFPAQSTVILDRNGTELYRLFSEEDRTYVRSADISDYVKQATIAIEDERFLGRSTCFDVTGFMRASLSQIAPGYFVRSGGSTLTQQFAGNALVGRKRSLVRKIRELMLACELERKYDKNELLELYLNWIPYGHNAYGIEQASKNYFGTNAKSLTLAQASVLAALPQRPSYFSPYGSHVYTRVSDVVRLDIANQKIGSKEQIPDSAIQIGLIGRAIGSGSTALYIGGRTDQVLRNMLDQKQISEEEYETALSELKKMTFAPERQNIRAPHFVLQIQQEVLEHLGIDTQGTELSGDKILEQGGFRITTTLDWGVQQAAEKAVTTHREDIAKRFGARNAALVALAPKTREILAYVGNIDFSDDEYEGKIDMARSPRQPGSSFKPFTYLAAFEAGYGPGSVIYDTATKFGEDRPQNFDGTFWGLQTMRTALGASRNIPAIKAFFLGGGENALLDLAERMGIRSPKRNKEEYMKNDPDYGYGWPLAIGSAEVPLLEMVHGYATIADAGVVKEPVSILKITDKDGNIRYQAKEEPGSQVIDPRLTAQMTSVLSDVGARPNDYWKSILSVPGYEAATKTGTSNKCLERDRNGGCTLRRPESVWTIGYTPNLIAGVWVGNATSQSLFDKADGLTTAAPIWNEFMIGAHKTLKEKKTTFTVPDRIARPLVSRLSGELASECTPPNFRTSDLFLRERVPVTEDSACIFILVDKVTGLLASDSCPVEAREERAFFMPRSELPNRWPQWEDGVQAWAKAQMARYDRTQTGTGSALPLPLAPTESCDMSKTPGRLIKPEIRFLYPEAGEEVPYPAFAPVVDATIGSAIKEMKFEIDDRFQRTFTEPPFSGSLRVPRLIHQEGEHTLTVTVTDMYENTATDTVQFRFLGD